MEITNAMEFAVKDMAPGNGNISTIQKLSLHERFRLIEIAHETRDHDIKTYAIALLSAPYSIG